MPNPHPRATVAAVMTDPCTSHWLRESLQTAFDRDLVDAVNDAETLLRLLKARLESDPDFVKGEDKPWPRVPVDRGEPR